MWIFPQKKFWENFHLLLTMLLLRVYKSIIVYFQDYTPLRCVLKTAALSIFPVLYFFTFLYYTDPGSTFCVLLMYLLSLYDNHLTSAGMILIPSLPIFPGAPGFLTLCYTSLHFCTTQTQGRRSVYFSCIYSAYMITISLLQVSF